MPHAMRIALAVLCLSPTSALCALINLNNFAVSNNIYGPTTNMTNAVLSEFGTNYRLADWNDILAYRDAGNSVQAFVDFLRGSPSTNTLGYSWVSFNGVEIQSCCVSGVVPGQTLPRHYFVAAHDGNRPSNFLAFQTIDNQELDLGSWIRDYPILAFTETEIPEPTTLALMVLGIAGIGYSRKRTH